MGTPTSTNRSWAAVHEVLGSLASIGGLLVLAASAVVGLTAARISLDQKVDVSAMRDSLRVRDERAATSEAKRDREMTEVLRRIDDVQRTATETNTRLTQFICARRVQETYCR
jgi:hypothetical protein